MTYDEYIKGSKKEKKIINFFKKMISKMFTAIIFSMIVIILSNYSPKFRNFLINDILNKSLDFSKFNKIVNKITPIKEKTEEVSSVIELNKEKYLDGVKYNINGKEDIYLKDSGIVTYIGEKEGYGHTIIIQQSNGYYAWYGNVSENVKLYDYIEKGSVIGSAEEKYYYVLLKDDKPVDINEY